MITTADVSPLAFAGTFAVAILLVLSFVGVARFLRREKLLYAAGLTLAAAVYPILVFAGSYHEKLAIKVTALLVFSFVAFLGFKWHVRWLAVGWGGHAIWDVLFPSAPWWYVHGCAVFDFFLAGYIMGGIPAAPSTRATRPTQVIK